MRKIFIILILVFFISGCYDYRELNDMSVVTGIGINYKDDKYIVSLEVTKSIKDGSSNEIETIVYTGENKVLADAFLEAKNSSDKYVYMEHVNILLVSESLCKKGIGDIVDYIVRDTTINSNYYMAVVDDPGKVFEIKQENDSTSNVITNTINYYLDDTSFDDLDIMSSYMINKNDDIAIPFITLDKDKVTFNKVAYFNGDKMVGKIDSKLYTLLRLNSDNEIIIKICCEGLIKEINKKVDMEKDDSYNYLSRIISKDMEEDIRLFLDETLTNNSDLLGLQDKYYKKYKKIMNNINYKVDVNLKINKNGIIYGVLYDK